MAPEHEERASDEVPLQSGLCRNRWWFAAWSFCWEMTVTSSFQAEFSEINLVADSTGTYNVNIDAIRNGHKVNR